MARHCLHFPKTVKVPYGVDPCHNVRNYDQIVCFGHSASGFTYNKNGTIKGVAYLDDVLQVWVLPNVSAPFTCSTLSNQFLVTAAFTFAQYPTIFLSVSHIVQNDLHLRTKIYSHSSIKNIRGSLGDWVTQFYFFSPHKYFWSLVSFFNAALISWQ